MSTHRTLPFLLWRYLGLAFLRSYLTVQGVLVLIYALFSALELLRRASHYNNVGVFSVLSMAINKTPQAVELTLPFAALLAAMGTLYYLSKRHELTVLRAAGLSVWQIARPLMAGAALVGTVFITALHPLGAMMTAQFKAQEVKYLARSEKILTITQQGIWVKESAPNNGDAIVHAEKVSLDNWSISHLMVLTFDKNGAFLNRLDAPAAQLAAGEWRIENATIHDVDGTVTTKAHMVIKTALTRNDIVRSFSEPDTISFWHLPRFIKTLADTGLETGPTIMYYQGLLALPLFLPAMVLLAATVSMRPPRFQTPVLMGIIGITAGFGVFFLSNFLKALGNVHNLPTELAAWIPPVIVLLSSATYLLNKEDG